MVSVQTSTGEIAFEPTIVPVVTPEGKVRNVRIFGVDHSGWFEGSISKGWKLKPGMAAEGYLLLEEVYLLEGNPAGWAKYQRYLADWQDGRTRFPFPRGLLPRTVEHRQRS